MFLVTNSASTALSPRGEGVPRRPFLQPVTRRGRVRVISRPQAMASRTLRGLARSFAFRWDPKS
jgi:hypothetical protein